MVVYLWMPTQTAMAILSDISNLRTFTLLTPTPPGRLLSDAFWRFVPTDSSETGRDGNRTPRYDVQPSLFLIWTQNINSTRSSIITYISCGRPLFQRLSASGPILPPYLSMAGLFILRHHSQTNLPKGLVQTLVCSFDKLG